jgi:hypothetical protein
MEAVCFSEILVTTYITTWRRNPDLNFQRCGISNLIWYTTCHSYFMLSREVKDMEETLNEFITKTEQHCGILRNLMSQQEPL